MIPVVRVPKRRIAERQRPSEAQTPPKGRCVRVSFAAGIPAPPILPQGNDSQPGETLPLIGRQSQGERERGEPRAETGRRQHETGGQELGVSNPWSYGETDDLFNRTGNQIRTKNGETIGPPSRT